MFIETTRHNYYSYIRQTGEIVSGIVPDDDFVWTFNSYRAFSAMPDLDTFILGITEQCNLRCSYCCYSGEYPNNRTHSSRVMTRSNIDAIYEFIQQHASKRPLYIAFYGGEPLLHYDLLKYAIDKGKERWGSEVSFSVSSNATLLSESKAEWLIANNVRLDFSIDGTAKYHNRNRIDSNGNGSFKRMYKSLAYIVNNHYDYLSQVRLLMTLPSNDELPDMAREWNEDPILKQLAPSQITSLAPNFTKEVAKRDYNILKQHYLHLLEVYEHHRDWILMKAYIDGCISDWKDRPILKVDRSVPMSTCMPLNTKLFIDASMQIAVCEKISDKFRIGSIRDGIDWGTANKQAIDYYEKRVRRCSHCQAIRMCGLCLTAVEFNDEQWESLCHNERVYSRLYMWLFCEMAERNLLE